MRCIQLMNPTMSPIEFVFNELITNHGLNRCLQGAKNAQDLDSFGKKSVE